MGANKAKQKDSPKRKDSDGPLSRHMDKRKLHLVKKKGKTAKLKLDKGKTVEVTTKHKLKRGSMQQIRDVKSTMEK